MYIDFFCLNLLTEGYQKGLPKICELFCDVKIENGFLGQRKVEKKWACVLKRNCKHIFKLISPVHNSNPKLCTGMFNFKNDQK